MRTATLKRLDALEALLDRKTRQPIALIEVDGKDPADRDAYLDGDDSVLTRYGFDPDDPSPGIRAIVISLHPERRDDWDDLRDLDDRRREEEAERRQLEAIQAVHREEAKQLPPVPSNAYTPEYDSD